MDSYLPFLLAITANSTSAATSRPSRTTAPQIKGRLRDTKGQKSLALNPVGSCLPGIPEQWHRGAALVSHGWEKEIFGME